MAGHAARRITAIVISLIMTALACADWSGVHYCRPTNDRFAIFTGSERFILNHGGSWELANPDQKADFDKWLAKAKLPQDLGLLISSAPIDHVYLLAGEIDARVGSDLTAKLEVKLGTDEPVDFTVKPTSNDEAKPDAAGSAALPAIAKKLGKPVSALLVGLADTGEKVTGPQAWGKFLRRLASSKEFFVYVDKNHGVLWVRRLADAAPIAAVSGSQTDETSKPAADEANVGKPKSSGGMDGLVPLLSVAMGFLGLSVGFLLGRAKRSSKPKTSEPAFKVSARERELVEVVRQEAGRQKSAPGQVSSGEDQTVAQMLERYRRHESLLGQIEQLKSYKSFKDDHDSFQKKIDKAVAAAKASDAKSAAASADLEKAKSQSAGLDEQLKAAQNEGKAVAAKLSAAEKSIQGLERKDAEFQQLYSELVNRTAAVCHDILLTRPRGDTWAASFAFVANYSIAYLGLARQCRDQRMFDAMVINLSRLSEAMAKSFPDRKLVVDPWRRAAAAFGEKRAPSYDTKPHPHVDSLSPVVLTLRDTGPSLSDFREMYAPSDGGLHIIRPA